MRERLYQTLFACFWMLFFMPVYLMAQWQKLEAPGVTGVGLVESKGVLYTVVSGNSLLQSNDRGLHWQPAAASPLQGNERYLSIDGDANWLVVLTLDENTFTVRALRSGDGAQSWQTLPVLPGNNTYSDRIFVQDGNVYCLRVLDYKLYRYDSSANNWVLVLAGWMLDYGFDNNAIWAVRSDGKLLYSPDQGLTWQTVSTPFADAASVEADANHVVVAAAGGVYASTDNGVTWIASTLPSSPYTARIFAEDGAFYAVFTWYGTGKVYRSTDGFQTYQLVFSGNVELFDWVDINNFWVLSTFSGLYNSPHDPAAWQWLPAGITINDYVSLTSAGGALFYNGRQTAFSTDEGNTWQVTNGQYGFTNILFSNGVWYTGNGGVWQSTNLKDWAQIPNTSFPPSNEILPIWEFVGNTMIFLSHYPALSLYTSTDYGQNWQTAGAFPASVSFVENMVVHNNAIYILASGSVFKSTDLGATWQTLGAALTPGEQYNLLVAPGKIYVLSANNLLVSNDDGLTWTSKSLQSVNPNHTALSGQLAFNNGLIILPDDKILYYTKDDGASWAPVMAGFTGTPGYGWATTGNTVFVLDSHVIPWRRDNFNLNIVQYSGQVYRDLNNNNLFDAGEPGLPNTVLQLLNSHQYVTSVADGTFSFFAEAQNDQFKAAFPNQYCSFTPASYAVNGANSQLDFGLKCQVGVTDLTMNLESSTEFRPGFNTNLVLTVFNAGVENADGGVTITLDPAVDFVSATPPATQTGQTLSWSFSQLASLDKLNFSVEVQTPASTALGAVLQFTASATPNVPDQTPADNVQTVSKKVVGSYDPNDKQVSQAAYSPNDLGTGRPLVYTIRFQNTGSYYASTVVVRDTLSPNLDPGTLQVLGASHPFSWSLRGPGILEFRFDNIYLPDSVSDEPGSHGFIQFAIGLRASLPLGALTENTGHIYFDFNAPIVTNTVTTAVVSTSEPLAVIPLTVFPNPASDRVQVHVPVEGELEKTNWGVFDSSGRLVRVLEPGQGAVEFSVGELAPGLYRIWGHGGQVVYTAVFAVVH